MKLLVVWAIAGAAFICLLLLQKFGVIDLADGLFYGMGVIGYMLGISAATWALVPKKQPA